jgi:hypothetical protein
MKNHVASLDVIDEQFQCFTDMYLSPLSEWQNKFVNEYADRLAKQGEIKESTAEKVHKLYGLNTNGVIYDELHTVKDYITKD